jgi:hypothetical protein
MGDQESQVGGARDGIAGATIGGLIDQLWMR